jgi:hypothetical protein
MTAAAEVAWGYGTVGVSKMVIGMRKAPVVSQSNTGGNPGTESSQMEGASLSRGSPTSNVDETPRAFESVEAGLAER